MARKFLVDIDLAKNSLLNPVFHNLAADPGSAVIGQAYFSTTDDALRIYTSGGWLEVGTGAGSTVAWGDVTGKPSTFPPDSHTHTIGEVTSLQGALDAKIAGPASAVDERIAVYDGTTGKLLKDSGVLLSALANAVHNHVATDITDFATAVNTQIAAYVDSEAGVNADLDTVAEFIQMISDNDDAITTLTNAAVKRHAATIGDGSSTSIAVTHGLGTEDVIPEMYEIATKDSVGFEMTRDSVNQVTFTFGAAPASNSVRVVLLA